MKPTPDPTPAPRSDARSAGSELPSHPEVKSQSELNSTQVTPRVAKAMSLAFIAIIVLIPAIDLAIQSRKDEPMQVFDLFRGQGKADQASPILGHEIYGFRGHLLGSHTEITLIFPILIIHEDDHPSFSDLFQCFSNFRCWHFLNSISSSGIYHFQLIADK